VKLLPLILLVSIAPAIGQEKQQRIKVGEPSPEFTLKNQNGKDASLKQLIARKPVAIVFFRSADW
jgi:cytochrome oxidase Cu insertion factor (SCO1/SenC/PrrC family)